VELKKRAEFGGAPTVVDSISVQWMNERRPNTTRVENNSTTGAAQQNARKTPAEMRSIGRSFTTFNK
jgi:hypothetical protein